MSSSENSSPSFFWFPAGFFSAGGALAAAFSHSAKGSAWAGAWGAGLDAASLRVPAAACAADAGRAGAFRGASLRSAAASPALRGV